MKHVVVVCLCALLSACAARRPAELVSLPPPPPPGEPASLVGVSADALKVAFGAPAFARTDADTQMWRYDGAACRAFFFLYPDKGGLVVRHVETLPHTAAAAADQACLDALRVKTAAPVS